MSTITLYKDKLNSANGFIDNILKSLDNLDVQLDTLKSTLQGVDSSTCDLQATVDSISSSSKSEEDKIDDLKRLNGQLTSFIDTAANRDSSAKSEINKAKEDFYSRYSYLKPECEKSKLEKICDAIASAAEWCAEHWKLIVTIVVVVVAVVLLCTGVGAILAGACWGAIMGAVIGGVSGGLESMANGGSFFEGFENGAFSGAISGAIMGGAFAGLGQLGALAGKGLNAAYKGAACISKIGRCVKGVAAVTKVMSTVMGGFDTIALLDKAFGNGDIAALNAKLHQSKAYNFFQLGVSAVAAFTGGMTTTMKCFVAGTLVLTASGLVAIEQIKAGDLVIAADEDSLVIGKKKVLETYVRTTDKLVHLTINGEKIITTYDHPFYVRGKGFVNACALCIGSELVDADGNILRVENIFREELHDGELRTVYNFQVEEFHTYFVGENCVLVHNAEGYGTPFNSEQQSLIKEAKAKKKTGVTRAEAEDYVRRSHKAGLNAEIHEGHPTRKNPVSRGPHLHPHNHSIHIKIID